MGALVSMLLFAATTGAAGADAPPPRDIAEGCPSGIERDQFRDVPPTYVHAAAVDCIVAYGVTTGTSPGTYSLSDKVTRGQIASFLARIVERTGGSLPSDAPDAFDDDTGSPHEQNINRLAAAGVIGGTRPRTFTPSGIITRGQMATFMVRIYEFRAGEAIPDAPEDYFVDDDHTVHEDNSNRLASVGVVGGTTPTTYEPRGTVPRGAMAGFIARLLDKLVEDGVIEPPAPGA